MFSLLAVGLVGFIGYFAVQSWLNSDPISLDDVDGRPVISVQQAPVISWKSALDNSGYDVSFPQCHTGLPDKSVGFAIVGLNNGKPFTENPCFARQWEWAKNHDGVAVYINTADPGKGGSAKYGAKFAKDAVTRLKAHGIAQGTPVWLDVETINTWSDPIRSVKVLNAAMRELAKSGYPVGVYAPPVHWFEITLNARVDVPVWLAIGEFSTTNKGVTAAKAACKVPTFGDALPSIVQFVTGHGSSRLDHNLMCTDPAGLVRPAK